MSDASSDWGPGASLATLRTRAALLARTRAFFASRGVLEVDTPALMSCGVTDPQIHALRADLPAGAGRQGYLQTSPEYAMKRLLAAGSGDIYQIAHVFRGEEQGPLHNGEFTLIEWYRLGCSLEALMEEVDTLVRELLGAAAGSATEQVSYAELFKRTLGLDPLQDSDASLRGAVAALGFDARLSQRLDRDGLLDLLLGTRLGPGLGQHGPCFVHRYPASQASLARLDPHDARVALRFELYRGGIELANGFEELASAAQQRARFAEDQRLRLERGLPVPAIDERLLAALGAGLPPCAGVALGFDRLVMLATGARHISEALPFAMDRV
jgi:elongation factor P--(R)-beta-lysine ligase